MDYREFSNKVERRVCRSLHLQRRELRYWKRIFFGVKVGRGRRSLHFRHREDVNPEKVARKRKMVPDVSDVDWEAFFLEGRLSECKNKDLKSKLRSVGDKVGGRKQDLVDRLTKYLEAEIVSSGVKQEES